MNPPKSKQNVWGLSKIGIFIYLFIYLSLLKNIWNTVQNLLNNIHYAKSLILCNQAARNRCPQSEITFASKVTIATTRRPLTRILLENSERYTSWLWNTKPVIISSMGIFATIANNTLYGSKWSIFDAKNFIWITFKGDFISIFRFFFAPSDSRFSNSCISAKYCHILT